MQVELLSLTPQTHYMLMSNRGSNPWRTGHGGPGTAGSTPCPWISGCDTGSYVKNQSRCREGMPAGWRRPCAGRGVVLHTLAHLRWKHQCLFSFFSSPPWKFLSFVSVPPLLVDTREARRTSPDEEYGEGLMCTEPPASFQL